MAQNGEPSYADLVFELMRSAEHPLTFQEIFDEVNRRRPLTTRNPKATIRTALGQGKQLVSLGDGRYGFLPHLVRGSLFRQMLTEETLADHPLIYSDELRQALWPSFFEIRKRKSERPARMQLPNGPWVELPLEFFGSSLWGSRMQEDLRRYLVDNQAVAGDSLLIRVLDGEVGRCEGWIEPQADRDKTAVAERNRELADTSYQILRKGRGWEEPIWDLAIALFARGAYRADVAPGPLEEVLTADPRFVDSGLKMWALAKSVTPEIQAIIRQRQDAGSGFLGSAAKRLDPAHGVAHSFGRVEVENILAGAIAQLSEKGFGSVEEVKALLRDALASGDFPALEAGTPLERAQELVYDAWEEPERRKRVRLAREALRISPDCADAFVLLAEETARTPQEAIDLYSEGMAAGERALGDEGFKQAVGEFWGIIQTRPYMRARLGLALTLWTVGRQPEAIQHLWEMLRLNPGDNQGLRYLLLSWLLGAGHELQVEKLLNRYPDDIAGQWLYGRALHAFRTEGNTEKARDFRDEARERNRHAPAYLLGLKKLPKQSPETIGIGDHDEAIVIAEEQAAAWRETPGALAWLDVGRRRG